MLATAKSKATSPRTAGKGDGAAAGPSGSGSGNGNALSAEDKAKVRRAQVRRAQVQHRQRKANYVRALELDVARVRDMVAATQREMRALSDENDAMRRRVTEAMASPSPSLPEALLPVVPSPREPEEWPLPAADDATLTMRLDEVLGTPTYQMQVQVPSPPSTNYSYSSVARRLSASSVVPAMTAEQTQQAINFILALEHCCWDHFSPADFEPASDPGRAENGHALMATCLALRTAPPAVFEAMEPSKPGGWRAALLGHGLGHAAARPRPLPESEWRVSGLTLRTLFGLACTVNPAHEVEVTPVQAWFELAAQWPVEVLLRADVVALLKGELKGVVRCVTYGAAVERVAFESVVARVLGPELDALWPADPATF